MTHAVDHIPTASAEPRFPEGTWNVDPGRSEIGFAVKAMGGLATVRGVFSAYDGSLTTGSTGAGGELTIVAASLDTGNRRRDRHLRSPDFFDVERHPQIVFTATGVAPNDDGLTVAGELVIGSARVRLELPMTVEHVAGDALRLCGSTRVPRAAAGLTWNRLGMVGDEAVLHTELTLVRAIATTGGAT
jgi:polyisoprenoid-binding protein YceI